MSEPRRCCVSPYCLFIFPVIHYSRILTTLVATPLRLPPQVVLQIQMVVLATEISCTFSSGFWGCGSLCAQALDIFFYGLQNRTEQAGVRALCDDFLEKYISPHLPTTVIYLHLPFWEFKCPRLRKPSRSVFYVICFYNTTIPLSCISFWLSTNKFWTGAHSAMCRKNPFFLIRPDLVGEHDQEPLGCQI